MTVRDPVLLIGFNRPTLMATVVDRLRQVRPRKLYVAIDGPRPGHTDDIANVEACRELVATIDWECEVATLFHDANLGCGRGVAAAITWFFTHEEQGVILEDDIVPDPTFFDFCETLLDLYRDDDRVFAISGCNIVPGSHLSAPQQSWRFSRIPMVWGWATWRRSWQRFHLDIRGWRTQLPFHRLLSESGFSLPFAASWASEFALTARGTVDTWDWQLTYAAMAADQLTATSNTNLVENIGYAADATHTRDGSSPLMPVQAWSRSTEEIAVRADRKADAWITRNHYGGGLLTTADRLRKYAQGKEPVVAQWL
jgi:hypothetical protein